MTRPEKKAMIKQLITFVVIFSMTLLSCRQKNTKMDIESIKLFQESINYPYIASEKREAAILTNMNKLEKGITKNQVIELMTNPDEANLTYKFKKKANPENIVGFSLVYILRRVAESGSVNEKNERLLRIHFDDTEKLIWSYSINIDEFKIIEKE